MIINSVVELIVSMLVSLFSFLPAGSGLPWDLTAGFAIVMRLDTWLPLHETLAGVGIIMGIAVYSFAWGLLRVVLRFLPFVGIG